MKSLGNKGQLGKLITSFPIILLVILLMAFYLFLVSSMKIGSSDSFSNYSSSSGDVLLKSIILDGNETNVLDAFISLHGDRKDVVFNSLVISLTAENKDSRRCLILNLDQPVTEAREFDHGVVRVLDYSQVASFYKNYLFVSDVSYSSQGAVSVQSRVLPFSLIPGKKSLLSYYGRCLHE